MDTKYKIHAGYILLILLAIIVELVTVKWADIPQLVQYITFSLTVTSLVLAVLAIVYAFVSNDSLGRTLSAVGEASRQVHDATNTLRAELTKIPSSLQTMEAKLDSALHREEEPEQAPTAVSEKAKSSEAPAKVLTIDEIASSFINITSLWGLVLVYAFSMAYERKFAFKMSELVDTTERLDRGYANGFLVAMRSARLMSYTLAHDVVNVTAMHETLKAKSRESLKDRIAKLEVKQNALYQDLLDRVEEFFQKS